MAERFFIKLPTSVQKSMRKIPLPWRERVARAIESLALEPFQGEKMLGRYSHARKIRVWPYRIIYTIDKDKKIISLLEVAHRGSVSYD